EDRALTSMYSNLLRLFLFPCFDDRSAARPGPQALGNRAGGHSAGSIGPLGRSVGRADYDPVVRLDAHRLALHARRRVDDVVDALALERGHGLEADRLTELLNPFRSVLGHGGERLATRRAETAHIEHQARRLAGLPKHRQPSQLLQCLQGRTSVADELVQSPANDLNDGPTTLHELIDVTVVVEDVEQALDVVRGDLALPEEFGLAWLLVDLPVVLRVLVILPLVILRRVTLRLVLVDAGIAVRTS